MDYGNVGDRIPGSQYVRAYCSVCGDPIRVMPGNERGPCLCAGCNPGIAGRPGRSAPHHVEADVRRQLEDAGVW